MKRQLPIFFFFLSSLTVYSQDCNILFEDFESYDCQSEFIPQTNGSWIKLFDDASDPIIYCNGDPSNSILDITSIFDQGTGSGESEFLQVLNLATPQIIDYKFEYYDECGLLTLDFLESFTDTANFTSIKRIKFDGPSAMIAGQDTLAYCTPPQNASNPFNFRLDFQTQKFHVICMDSILYSLDFDNVADKLVGVAYGSNQCNYVDNICISEYGESAPDMDSDGYASDVDCDDNDPEVNPGATEIPYNGKDDDCNPMTLEDDLDQDGFLQADDCNDDNAAINPDAEEIPNNDVDEDCDGEDQTTSTNDALDIDFHVYPNPTANEMYVEWQENIDIQIELLDIHGKSLYVAINPKVIQLSELSNGMYLMRIHNSETGFITSRKIYIMR